MSFLVVENTTFYLNDTNVKQGFLLRTGSVTELGIVMTLFIILYI